MYVKKLEVLNLFCYYLIIYIFVYNKIKSYAQWT